MKLRDYQLEAVDAVKNAALRGYKRILVAMATGSGKSAVIAEMARRSSKRVLVLCHQAEILSQNQRAFEKLASEQSGIYCAGLNKKELEHRVTFAHRDSLGQDAVIETLGQYPLLISDESHLISTRQNSRYQRIIEKASPNHIVGLTATPYRLSGGIIYGRGKFFECCAYSMTISKLIERGYLSPYRIENIVVFSAEGVETKGNDFNQDELSAIALQERYLDESAKIIIDKTQNRNLSLIFCVGREHAKEIQKRVPNCEYIDGETNATERANIIERMKIGQIKHVVNVGVLTTGVDVPMIDTVVMLRPTQSASLYVQCVGRGLRLHESKKELLILELTDNFDRFGSIDDPMLFGSARESEITITIGQTEAPSKKCENCDTPSPNGTKVCGFCGMLFLKKREDYGDDEIISLDVYSSKMEPVVTQKGNNAILVTFQTNLGVVKEWLNLTNPHPVIQRLAKAKLAKLRQTKVTVIRVRAINQKFPKILTYHAN